MRPNHRLIDRRLAQILVILQVLLTFIATLLLWQIEGAIAAKSLALGAGLCTLASGYFAWQSFRYAGAQAAKQVMLSMYRGLMGKFAIVIVGFVLIFRCVQPIQAGTVFAGFMLVQAMAWVAPMIWSRWVNQTKPH